MALDTPNTSDAETGVVMRMGLAWCLTHREPVSVCHCRAASHNWGTHNALRRYLAVVAAGRSHPLTESGGKLVGFRESHHAVDLALKSATVERVPISSIIATNDVNREYVGQMLRGKGKPARTGNHRFESEDTTTGVRVGKRHVLLDGHHRVVKSWASGESHVKMRVLSGVTPMFANPPELLVRP